MNKITTLFWDLGGVVLSNGWDEGARAAAIVQFHLDGPDLENRHESCNDDYESGRMTMANYLQRTVFYRPRPFTIGEFTQFIFDQSSEKAETRKILDELTAARRYLMVVLNNEAQELNDYRIRTFQLARNFTAFLSSCYLGVRKPSERIYRLALEITQRAPEECIFIDDRPENLQAPRKLGMQAIRFENPAQLRSDLVKNGIAAACEGAAAE